MRGTQGGNPKWIDDGDGIRNGEGDELLDNDAASLNKPGWHVDVVTREGVQYTVDSRDYFIDFERLAAKSLLDQVPASASTDNRPQDPPGPFGPDGSPLGPSTLGLYNGSYSWYVDRHGKVQSLSFFFPEPDKTGFQTAYP